MPSKALNDHMFQRGLLLGNLTTSKLLMGNLGTRKCYIARRFSWVDIFLALFLVLWTSMD
jgi:hypothetical protein